MGPFSGLMFLVGAIMILVGRNRNNDFLFSQTGSSGSDGEFDRIRFLIMGVLLVVGAVAIWIFLLIYGEPAPLPDYSSLMNRNSSQ